MILLKANTEEGGYFIFHPTMDMEEILETDEDGNTSFSPSVASEDGKSLDMSRLSRMGFDFLGLEDLFEIGFEVVLSDDEEEMEIGIKLLEAGLAVFRDVPKAWLGLGFAYKMKEDYYQAIDCLESIFTIPDEAYQDEDHRKFVHMAMYRDLVFCCGRLGDHAHALDYARQGYEISPEDLGTVINLASAFIMTGDLENARKYFKEAEKIDPEDGQVKEALLEIETKIRES